MSITLDIELGSSRDPHPSEGVPPYELSIDGLPEGSLRVKSFSGTERFSDAYSFDLLVTAHVPVDEELERTALGQRAVLIWNVGKAPRAFYGLVAGVRLKAVHEADATALYRIRFVPRLWLLKKKKRTRIFQNLRVPDIVTSVLGEVGISARFQLQRDYPVREYCTQYEETDYAFVKRILAEAGIFFYFPTGGPMDGGLAAFANVLGAVESVATSAIGAVAGSAVGSLVGAVASAAAPLIPGDTVVCADDAAFYPPIGADDAGDLLASTAAALAPEVGNAIGDAMGGMGPTGSALLGGASAVAGAAIAAFTSKGAPTLTFLGAQQTTHSPIDKITSFTLRTGVESNLANYREYDPDRPMVRVNSNAMSTQPFPPSPLEAAAAVAMTAANVASAVAPGALGEVGGAIASGIGQAANLAGGLLGDSSGRMLEVYEHHGHYLFPKWTFAAEEAARILRQKRRRVVLGQGVSGCPDLAPGHRFALYDHPANHLDRPYVVTEITHHGKMHSDGPEPWRVYENAFECAPAEVSYVPRRPKRKAVQATLTATVVGPPGEEIWVDAVGQIKVQFHWDRDGSFDDKSSCWIRTMHPWGGASFGVQFIPRVGMEVVVTFEGGDPDKPLVLGSAYNATHPTAFLLPKDKTKSGWVTRSSPGGAGFNELSFEDATGRERVFVHAQRNLDEIVEFNHTCLVKNDEFVRIIGNRLDRIEKNLEQHVKGDHSSYVEGNRLDVVTGNRDDRVTGMQVTRLEGKERRSVTGSSDHEYAEDWTTRVKGCMTTLVGRHDKKRSWLTHAEGTAKLSSLDGTEVSSEKELTLRVGKSSIRITEEQIEISAPGISVKGGGGGVSASKDGLALSSKGDAQLLAKKKIVLKTEGASLAMEKQVKVDGSQILLNSPEQATDAPPKEPEPPTKIELKDQDGSPLGYHRFLVKTDDGSEISGMTDKDGKAELELTSSGKIAFPDANSQEKPGVVKPYVVRQRDYLQKLAHRMGFDAEGVWNHPKNEELKKKRDPNLLCPGDVLYVPDPQSKWEVLRKSTTNPYSVVVPKTTVQLVLSDSKGPIANEICHVEGLGEVQKTTTDANGTLSLKVPVHITECRVTFPNKRVTYPVHVGAMDPIEDASGLRKRLEHLGYLPASDADLFGEPADDDLGLQMAVRDFQKANGLTTTGIVDDATRDALVNKHGS